MRLRKLTSKLDSDLIFKLIESTKSKAFFFCKQNISAIILSVKRGKEFYTFELLYEKSIS